MPRLFHDVSFIEVKPHIKCNQVVVKLTDFSVFKSPPHECKPGRHKLAVKIVDIFDNDTMTIVEMNMGNKKK